MKTERTIDTMAVVTPNCAMERRSHTSSYRTLQNPEMKKKRKYQINEGPTSTRGVCALGRESTSVEGLQKRGKPPGEPGAHGGGFSAEMLFRLL